MSVPTVRRIVVGVDGSAESAAAVRWACREAGLRGAEVHAVHAWEAPFTASYAVSPVRPPDDSDFDVLWRAVLRDQSPDVPVRTEVVAGRPARALLERCAGADMLVLGTASEKSKSAGYGRSAGPVIRACLRCSPCPVVVISADTDPLMNLGGPGHPTDMRVPEPSSGPGSGSGRRPVRGIVPVPAGLHV